MAKDLVQKIDNIEKGSIAQKITIDIDTLTKAVALSYDQIDSNSAPVVIAKGRGYIAKKIIDSAREHDIAVVRDSKLVNNLMPVSLGHHIPAELYDAVAHIFVYLSELDKKVGDRYE